MSIKMSIVFYKYSVPLYKYFKENTNTLLQLQAFEALLLSHISSAVFSPARLEFPGPLCSVRVQSSAQPGDLGADAADASPLHPGPTDSSGVVEGVVWEQCAQSATYVKYQNVQDCSPGHFFNLKDKPLKSHVAFEVTFFGVYQLPVQKSGLGCGVLFLCV